MQKCISILLALSLASCEQEVAETPQAEGSKDVFIENLLYKAYYETNLEDDTGVPDDLLPPYAYLKRNDNGVHEYIYVLDDQKKPQWAILVYSSPKASIEAFQIFKETPTENGVKRSPITETELATHLDIIERKLIHHYGETTYRRYYTGGIPEDEQRIEDTLITTDEAEDDMSLDAIEQRMAAAINEQTLYHIAHLIHYLRASIKEK